MWVFSAILRKIAESSNSLRSCLIFVSVYNFKVLSPLLHLLLMPLYIYFKLDAHNLRQSCAHVVAVAIYELCSDLQFNDPVEINDN